jgi:hypothetical protein
VAGTWSTGASRFMIVPAQKIAEQEFSLPVGVMTSKVADLLPGAGRAVTVHKAAVQFEVADAAAFAANPSSKVIMQESIADASERVEKDHVLIISIAVATSRRLGESAARRLAAGKIECKFEIHLPASSTVKFTKATVNPAMLATAITSNAAQKGITVNVTGTPTVTKVVTETIGTEAEITGGASPMTGSALTALSLVMAAMFFA